MTPARLPRVREDAAADAKRASLVAMSGYALLDGRDGWRKNAYLISTDPERLDRALIWEFLRTSYWASGITRETVDRSIDNALSFGLFAASGEQVGFARVVTDHVRFAWISDVFVLDAHRGTGLGVWLVETLLSHPDLADARVMLGTSDAHRLYERFGFAPADPERVMDRRRRPR